MENGRKALEGWNVKSNSNPLYPGRIAEMINHSAGFPLDRTDKLYYTEFGNDTVAVQTHRSKKKMVRDKSNSQKNNHTHFLRYFLKYFSQKYNNSFFPLFSKYWSKLPLNLRSEQDILIFKENLKLTIKSKRQKHYTYGDKHTNALLCRLRVGRSLLKSHSFAINMSSTDRCLCGEIDTIQSYFLTCFLFQNERLVLLDKINQILPRFHKMTKSEQCDVLLFGINTHNIFSRGIIYSIFFLFKR